MNTKLNVTMESKEIQQDPYKKKALKLFWSLFVFFFLYAISRHHIFKGVDWFFVSSYTLNKALAWTALTSVALSYSISSLAKLDKPWALENKGVVKYLGQWGFIMGMVHAVLSLRITTPVFFANIYDSNLEFNTTGNLLILFGILTLSALIMPGISSLPSVRESLKDDKFKKFQKLGYLALIFGATHVFVVGYSGWFSMSNWHGYMPPITLLSFLIALVPLVLKILLGKRVR